MSVTEFDQTSSKQSTAYAPLSYGQQGLWFLHQLAPESAAYNLNITGWVRTRLDIPALHRSLQTLLERHTALRRTFAAVGGEPMQQVQPAALAFSHEDATGWSDCELETRVAQTAHRPFALGRGPVFQVHLFTRATDEHVLLLKFHHIIADYWSLSLFLDELGRLYRAEHQGRTLSLAPIQASYDQFVAAQAEMVCGPEGIGHQQFWQQQLAGELSRLNLPLDKVRSSAQAITDADRGAVKAFVLDSGLTRQLRALAETTDVKLPVIMLAAFKVLLYRYTQQADILVNSFFHGRSQPEFRQTVGYFINSTIVRSRLHSQLRFVELLDQLRATMHAVRAHADYPISLVAEQLTAETDARSSALFQIGFNMVRASQPGLQGLSIFTRGEAGGQLDLHGLRLESFPIKQPWSQFELTLTIEDAGETLLGFLDYSLELFLPETMERMAAHLDTLLRSIVAQPEQPLSAIGLMRQAEIEQIVVDWNATSAPYPQDVCLHTLFEQQARRTPDQPAAVLLDQRLSYAELDARANQLAHHLRRLGVGPDVPVGVCVDRSLELMIALLGVLKAGGAYLPLDTDLPDLRREQLLRDAQAPVCLVAGASVALPGAVAIAVDIQDGALLTSYPTSAPAVAVQPQHLVSIYYTSGSTGQPKGVASTHEGWVNRMVWMQRQYGLQPHESVLQKTTLTFDDAAVELFWPLIVGATVAMIEPGLHKDPRAIIDAAIRHQVAVLHFVPSMLTLFAGAVTPQDRARLTALRHVISSGEALRSELVRLFQERVGCQLHNQWGATEVSIDSTLHTCTSADAAEGRVVPIGHPIANNRVYILDAQLEPVPVGVPGDLYLAGVGLARGYLNDEQRTQAAFIADPFVPGARMYKTGDRGRYQPDGAIIFLGRSDDQVKIRGQRVELAEIEAVLAEHPDVKDCAVVAFKQPEGYRLVGYGVLAPAATSRAAPDAETLRAFLRTRLPDYMVPGRIVLQEQLPLTASGKIDRQRLPDPGTERPDLNESYVPPRSATERTLAAIWQQVLGLSRIGVQDHFFGLGGHSLDATRIVSRINQELQIHLPLKALFECPSVAELARRVEQELVTGGLRPQLPIARVVPQPSYELSHAQQRFWFAYQFDQQHAYGALLTLEIDGPLDIDLFPRVIPGLLARHSLLRTTFAERDGLPVQIIHDTLASPCRYQDLTSLAPGECAAALREGAAALSRTPFDLEAGPIFQTVLYRISPSEHRLLCSFHPICLDGWCVTILMRDIQTLYQAYQQGYADSDLALPLQYVDYAAWQQQRLHSGELAEQREYWQTQLAGFTGAPPLPSAPLPPRQPDAATHRLQPLSPALMAQVQTLATAEGTTVYVVLLAALKLWIASVTGASDITVGSPVSGRNRAELETIFGVLWNPVVVRTDLSGNPSWLQTVRRVNQSALAAFANQDYPFDLIVQDLWRQPSGAPNLYNIVFVVQNASQTTLTFDEITLRLSLADRLAEVSHPEAADSANDPVAQFDLHIEARELDGQLTLMTQYNPARFGPETVDSFMQQFVTLLEQVMAAPELRLSEIELLGVDALDDLFGADQQESSPL